MTTMRWFLLLLVVLPAGCRSYASEADMLEFVDDTAKFKGRELTFRMYLDIEYRETLRDRVGGPVDFHASPRGGNLRMKVQLPRGLEVPNAKGQDRLVV